MSLSVVLVGLGRIGWKGFGESRLETHADQVMSHPGLSLDGAFDIDPAVRREFGSVSSGIHLGDTLGGTLDSVQPDLVLVATPAETHKAVVAEAVLRPTVRGILCEKPLAPTVSECREIIDLCKGRALLVGHQRRYESRHLSLLEFIGSGGIGAIKAGMAYFSGEYLNNGSHAVDVMRMLVGDSLPWTVQRSDRGFSVSITGSAGQVILQSGGDLEPGYMKAMYDDLIGCVYDPDLTPDCSGEDGLQAVRGALQAEERDAA